MRTYSPKASEITRKWYVIDAEDLVLGRLSTEAARILRGKHKPTFAPHLDTGDHVIVVNAEKVVLTANKAEQKLVYRHSGYPGGLKSPHLRARPTPRKPEEAVRRAVRGHAPEEPPRPPDAHQAQGLRRPRPPPLGAACPSPSTSPPPGAPRRRSAVPQPLVQSTGRRKQAIARVRVRPSEGEGDGTITVNKRGARRLLPVEDAPDDPHRAAAGHRDSPRPTTSTPRIHGGGPTGQAGALRLGIARALIELDPELRAGAQEGRLPHARRAREGVEEVRPQEGPQGSAVLQALERSLRLRCGPRRMLKFGTDGVRGGAPTSS